MCKEEETSQKTREEVEENEEIEEEVEEEEMEKFDNEIEQFFGKKSNLYGKGTEAAEYLEEAKKGQTSIDDIVVFLRGAVLKKWCAFKDQGGRSWKLEAEALIKELRKM